MPGVRRFRDSHRKPDWSEGDGIGRETAERILGTLPVLQVDDWEGERIAEVPFQLVEAWDGQALSGWETDDPAPGSSEGSSSYIESGSRRRTNLVTALQIAPIAHDGDAGGEGGRLILRGRPRS